MYNTVYPLPNLYLIKPAKAAVALIVARRSNRVLLNITKASPLPYMDQRVNSKIVLTMVNEVLNSSSGGGGSSDTDILSFSCLTSCRSRFRILIFSTVVYTKNTITTPIRNSGWRCLWLE
jgi:hypothetical protein